MGYLDCAVKGLGCILGLLKKGDWRGQPCLRVGKLMLPGGDRGWRERAPGGEPTGSPRQRGDLTKSR